MSETAMRAMWFALFASIALILGGFALGYGTAMLAAPLPEAAPPPLPTLVRASEGGTRLAKDGDDVVLRLQPEQPPTVAVGSAESANAASVGIAPTAGPRKSAQATGAGLAVTLDGFDVDLSREGVEVVLQLQNNSHETVTFSFWPESDLSLEDDQGRQHEMRWAEFDGKVTVAPGEDGRLVRAFFAVVPDGDTRYLTVSVEHPPQLPKSRWRVPVARANAGER